MVKTIWLLVALLFSFQGASGQTTIRNLFLNLIEEAEATIQHTGNITSENTSPGHSFWEKTGAAQLGYLVLGTYQTFISSQDVPACNFYPSCSHFAQDALVHAPFPVNLFLISDRLQRCNGLPGKERFYPFDPRTGRFRDPITNYTNQRTP